jgi:hypothetical protein
MIEMRTVLHWFFYTHQIGFESDEEAQFGKHNKVCKVTSMCKGDVISAEYIWKNFKSNPFGDKGPDLYRGNFMQCTKGCCTKNPCNKSAILAKGSKVDNSDGSVG